MSHTSDTLRRVQRRANGVAEISRGYLVRIVVVNTESLCPKPFNAHRLRIFAWHHPLESLLCPRRILLGKGGVPPIQKIELD